MKKTSSLTFPNINPHAKMRIFFFHHAGGSSSTYAPWLSLIHPDIQPVFVDLPGRSALYRVQPIDNFSAAVDYLLSEISPYLELPYAMFGHSMGGLLAFELSHRLTIRNCAPVHLFVSACRLPNAERLTASKPRTSFSDEEMIEQLRTLNGTPEVVFKNKEMLSMVLRMMKSDYTLLDSRSPQNYPALPLPITALGGHEDIFVSTDDIKQWGTFSVDKEKSKAFLFSGGHFFTAQHREQIVGILNDTLR
jgi:medium-chain acyl-[acyl-carrier-protein] hydrolase